MDKNIAAIKQWDKVLRFLKTSKALAVMAFQDFKQQELQQHDFLSHECAVVPPKKLIEEAAEGDKDDDIHFDIIKKLEVNSVENSNQTQIRLAVGQR